VIRPKYFICNVTDEGVFMQASIGNYNIYLERFFDFDENDPDDVEFALCIYKNKTIVSWCGGGIEKVFQEIHSKITQELKK